MVRPVRIAVQIDHQHADYDVLRDATLRAEEVGVDVVFNLDHFFPYSADPAGKHFEALTMLASLARIADYAQAGEVIGSRSVVDAADGSVVAFRGVGPVELKGVARVPGEPTHQPNLIAELDHTVTEMERWRDRLARGGAAAGTRRRRLL